MQTWLYMLADAAPNAPAGDGGGFGQMLVVFAPMILMFLVLNYFLVSRPQQREQSRHQAMLDGLKKNDRVLTAGGLIGQVVSLSEDKKEITLRVDDNTRIKFRTESIRGLLDSPPSNGGDGAKAT